MCECAVQGERRREKERGKRREKGREGERREKGREGERMRENEREGERKGEKGKKGGRGLSLRKESVVMPSYRKCKSYPTHFIRSKLEGHNIMQKDM